MVRVALTATLLAGLVPFEGRGQPVVDCSDCEVEPTVVVELGSLDGPGAVGDPAHITRRQNGEWVLADYHQNGVLKIYDAGGNFRRGIGRSGQGPGEYKIPERLFVTAGDSLKVVDFAGNRVTTLSHSLTYVWSQPIGVSGQSLALLPEGIVVAAKVLTAESVGLPLHFIDAHGEIVRSFGADPPIRQIRNSDLMWRGLAPTSGGVWSADLLRYRLERWSTDGTLIRRLERDVSWFPPQTDFGVRQDPGRGPAPGLPFISTDSEGRVWTVIYVPDPQWEAAFESGTDPYGRRTNLVHDVNKYFDSIVEVIDPRSAQVVVRAVFDQAIKGFAGEGLVFGSELRGPGYPTVIVWSISPPQDKPTPLPRE